MSKATTHREVYRIANVDELTQRMQGIHLATSPVTNCVEICAGLFKMPTLEQMLDAFEKDEAIIAAQGQAA